MGTRERGSAAGFEQIEHGADVGIRVFAPTLPELFRQAALGMYSLMVDIETVRPTDHVDIELAGDELDLLLVDFLNELLYHTDAEGMLFCDCDVTLASAGLQARCHGERYDPRRHTIEEGIKAATYHMLAITEQAAVGYEATIIFDV